MFKCLIKFCLSQAYLLFCIMLYLHFASLLVVLCCLVPLAYGSSFENFLAGKYFLFLTSSSIVSVSLCCEKPSGETQVSSIFLVDGLAFMTCMCANILHSLFAKMISQNGSSLSSLVCIETIGFSDFLPQPLFK